MLYDRRHTWQGQAGKGLHTSEQAQAPLTHQQRLPIQSLLEPVLPALQALAAVVQRMTSLHLQTASLQLSTWQVDSKSWEQGTAQLQFSQ